MLIRPDIGTESSRTKQPSSWVLKVEKSRRSISKGFLETPVDIIFEIASYLRPRDLLNLSRSSKHVRAVFLHRSSLAVWKRVLRKAGLPECPDDLMEPQYTSLVFDTNICMACGATPENITCDFSLRLRLCESCWEANVVHGVSLCPSVGATGEAFTLVPARGPKLLTTSWKNNALHYYFKPELEAAVIEEEHKYKSMSSKDFYEWVDERRAAATRMMQEGIFLEHWYQEWYAADNRSKKIRNKMEELGWDVAFFPSRFSSDYSNWNDVMVNSSELDEDGLAEVIRKLWNIYSKRRKEVLTKQATCEIEKYYRDYRYQLSVDEFVCVPGWNEVSSYRCVEQFIQDRVENHTTGHLEILMEKIVDEGKKTFVPQFEAMLINAIKVCDPSQGRVSKKRMMGRAINLFFCTCHVCAERLTWEGFRKVYGYPEIVDHVMRHVVFTGDHWSERPPSTDIMLIQSARDILKALGLRENSTREEVKNFGNVGCRCGHWRCEKPMTFERLVEHVYNQRLWTAKMRKLANPRRSKELLDTLLFEGHSQGNLASLIIRAPDRSRSSSQSLEADREISDRRAGELMVSNFLAGTCCFCYHIVLSPCVKVNADEPPEYHVLWKHGMKFKEECFMDINVLKKLYENPVNY